MHCAHCACCFHFITPQRLINCYLSIRIYSGLNQHILSHVERFVHYLFFVCLFCCFLPFISRSRQFNVIVVKIANATKNLMKVLSCRQQQIIHVYICDYQVFCTFFCSVIVRATAIVWRVCVRVSALATHTVFPSAARPLFAFEHSFSCIIFLLSFLLNRSHKFAIVCNYHGIIHSVQRTTWYSDLDNEITWNAHKHVSKLKIN